MCLNTNSWNSVLEENESNESLKFVRKCKRRRAVFRTCQTSLMETLSIMQVWHGSKYGSEFLQWTPKTTYNNLSNANLVLQEVVKGPWT